MENHFIALNAKWISNDFLFAIAGGAFASLVIVLVCELIHYRQLKLATENTLFIYLGNLYGQFLIIRSNCKRVLNNKDIVSDNLIQSSCNNAKMVLDSINGIDYTLWGNTNKITKILNEFKVNKYFTIKYLLTDSIFLRIAICEDKKILLSQGKQDLVTSDCPNTNKVLMKIVSQSTTILTFLDQIIKQIDNELGNKYQWQNKKKTINTYQDNYTSRKLEDYLKGEVVVI